MATAGNVSEGELDMDELTHSFRLSSSLQRLRGKLRLTEVHRSSPSGAGSSLDELMHWKDARFALDEKIWERKRMMKE